MEFLSPAYPERAVNALLVASFSRQPPRNLVVSTSKLVAPPATGVREETAITAQNLLPESMAMLPGFVLEHLRALVDTGSERRSKLSGNGERDRLCQLDRHGIAQLAHCFTPRAAENEVIRKSL